MVKKIKETAIKAALMAGNKLKEKLTLVSEEIKYKGVVDLVTQADLESEKIIVEEISHAFPKHDFLSEEGSEKKTNSTYLWLIDPLDGTTNYAHRYPIFSVSIALQFEGEVILGVVFDPNLNELFLAEKGEGAFLNGKLIKVSDVDCLNNSLLITGFPYSIREKPEHIFDYFKNFTLKAQGVRRCGSAALDLCSVASGRIDGFWEVGLKPWDTAAGSLILKEAGGTLTKFDGSPFDIFFPQVLATNGKIHQEMLDVFKIINSDK